MAAGTLSVKSGNDLETLRVLMTKMKNVYYFAAPNKGVSELGEAEMEFPVLEDGITFDTGAPEVSKIHLTEGRTWVSSAKDGTADITLNVSSIADAVNALFLGTAKAAADTGLTINGKKYVGAGYSLGAHKVTGALLFTDQAEVTAIYLPNIEAFASFTGIDGDNPAYYKVTVTPLADNDGASFYPLHVQG